MEEVWKDVVGYEGLYQVSNLGRVKSLERLIEDKKGRLKRKRVYKEKLLHLNLCKNGYCIVCLFRNQKKKFSYVHRLVADAFIPNPERKPEIDHINGIRNDNRIDNLRWVSHKENMNNPIFKIRQKELPKLCGESSPNWGRKASKEKLKRMSVGMALAHGYSVLQFSKDGKFIKKWLCGAIAARELGLNINHIYDCCKGRLKTSGGFVWKFADKK